VVPCDHFCGQHWQYRGVILPFDFLGVRTGETIVHVLTRRLGDFSARRPWAVIGVWLAALATMVILAGAAGGTFADDFSAPGSQSRQAQQLLEDRFPDAANGTALAVLIAKPGDTIEAHRAAVSDALARAETVDGVSGVGKPFAVGTLSADRTVAYVPINFDTPATDIGTELTDDNGERYLEPYTDAQLADAVNAAYVVGDDHIQEQSGGFVSPESFTHGTSKQRQGWFANGYKNGLGVCDTFAPGVKL
jgi:hypothetical protein